MTHPAPTKDTAASIQEATAYDVANIAKLLEEWIPSAGIAYPEVDKNSLCQWVLDTIVNGKVFLAVKGGRILGVLGVTVDVFPWNPYKKVLKDSFFYVPNGQRKLGVGDRLMKEAQAMAADFRVPLFMNIVSGASPDRIDRFYQIKGGVYLGGTLAFGFEEQEGSHG